MVTGREGMSGRNCDLLIYLLPALLFDFLLCLGILFGIVCAQSFCHASVKDTTDPSTDGNWGYTEA